MLRSALVLACLWLTPLFGEDLPPALSLLEIVREAESAALYGDGVNHIQTYLSRWHNKIVTVRGFLYKGSDNRWILAHQPNLKTCCVGVASKALTQITVQGTIEEASPHEVVTLVGTFQVAPKYDVDGSLTGLMALTDAKRESEGMTHGLIILCVIFGLILITGVFAVRRSGN